MTRFNDVLGWGDSVDITGLPDNVDVVFAGGAAPYIMHGWVNDNPFWFTYRNGGAWLQVGEEVAELPAGIDNNRVLWEAFATSDILDPSEWIKNSDYASFMSKYFLTK